MLIKPTNYEELYKLVDILLKTEFIHSYYRNSRESLAIAILFGMEIGLPPIASARNIIIVDGQPTISEDAILSLIYSSNLMGNYEQHYEGKEEDNTLKSIVRISRKDNPIAITSEFSMEDAKKANLLNKPIWKQYLRRMLLHRARSFALRDCFPNVLKGLRTREEMEDISPMTTKGEINNRKGDDNRDSKLGYEDIIRKDNNNVSIQNNIKSEDNNIMERNNTIEFNKITNSLLPDDQIDNINTIEEKKYIEQVEGLTNQNHDCFSVEDLINEFRANNNLFSSDKCIANVENDDVEDYVEEVEF